MDPFSILGAGAGILSSLVQGDAAKKQAEEQAAMEAKQLKAQQQAEALSAAQQTQKEQYTLLYVVGGVAALVAVALIGASALKGRKA